MLKMFVRNPQRSARRQAGFTLVEMSVVLLVIGLILGAVSIGKDLQRDAEYVKIKQKFIDQWVIAYNTYYERTGVVLGDSQIAPNFMVNGAAFGSGTSGRTGTMVGATEPAAICDADTQTAVSPSTQPTRAQIGTLYDEMDRHGIRMPPGRAEGSEARYVYLDSNGNPQEIQICFQWNPPIGATNVGDNSGNVMVIRGLTPDLARALDQMVDGKPDAREGMFRQWAVANDTVGVPGVEWKANNTNAQGLGLAGAASAAAASGLRLDEDQVITVVAQYKMNQ